MTRVNVRARLLGFSFATALAVGLLGCPPEKRPPSTPIAAPRDPARDLCRPHTVILVRHAEKAAVDPQERDPDLSAQGQARAARLATLLGKASVTRLVATEYKRTQQTLAPLGAKIGKPVEVSKASQTDDLVRELRDAPEDTTTVVATHSNVVPKIVHELGGPPLRDLGPDGFLPDTEFARVLVLTLGCTMEPSLVELTSDP